MVLCCLVILIAKEGWEPYAFREKRYGSLDSMIAKRWPIGRTLCHGGR